MKKIKITAMRIVHHSDLSALYENPIEHACSIKEGDVFIANGHVKPEGFCNSAWESIAPFVLTLSSGGMNIYDGWMKNPTSAMISCNDGFRPVSFYLETLAEEAD
jgi:TIGR04076 family protein